MAIYEITQQSLVPLDRTTFADKGIRERYDLQRVLRDHIEAIAPETYVLSEEYSNWEDAKRRIDLLCLDKQANLVVVELKRTEDGSYMDLQAIRYSAMVSTMTFNQAVEAHADYLTKIGRQETDAQMAILKFLDWEEPRESEFARETRIVLVSGDFSKELTTSVLWLNQRELDIRCVRLRPYGLENRTLLDIQQVIPLPEATEYQVQLRRKAAEERQDQVGGSDWTRYDLKVDGEVFPNLYKRRLVFLVLKTLVGKGIAPEQLMEIMPANTFLSVPGKCNAEEFQQEASIMTNSAGNPYDLHRYFVDDEDLLVVNDRTYAVSNQQSKKRIPLLDQLLKRFPNSGISFSKSTSDE